MLTFAEANLNIVTGAKGLGLLVASETPSAKGRTNKASPYKALPSTAGSGDTLALNDGVEGTAPSLVQPPESLPAAPSEFHLYADRGLVRSLLVNDYQKLLKIGVSVEGRYGDPMTFRVKQRPGVRAVSIQPAANCLWQHTKMLRDHESVEISAPGEVTFKTNPGFVCFLEPFLFLNLNLFFVVCSRGAVFCPQRQLAGLAGILC